MPVPFTNLSIVPETHTNRHATNITLSWAVGVNRAFTPVTNIEGLSNGTAILRLANALPSLYAGGTVIIVNRGSSSCPAVGTYNILAKASNSVYQIEMPCLSSGQFITNADAVDPDGQYYAVIQHSWDNVNWTDVCTLSPVYSTGKAATSYVHGYRPAGVLHYYRVIARNYSSTFDSSPTTGSSMIAALPAPLATLSLFVLRDATSATLSWTVPSSIRSTRVYEIQRSLDGNTWNTIYRSTAEEDRNEYVDTGLSPALTYHYRARHRFATTPTTVLSWRNPVCIYDVNDDGRVDVADVRLLVSYLNQYWPDMGVGNLCLPVGGPNPLGDPSNSPPPVDATYAPNGAYLNVTGGSLTVDSADLTAITNHFQFTAPYPARSAWSAAVVAEGLSGWYLYVADSTAGGIYRFWDDGTNFEHITFGTEDAGQHRGLAISGYSGQVVFLAGSSAPGNGTMYACTLTGDSLQLLGDTRGVKYLATHLATGDIYWTENLQIRKSAANGSGVSNVYTDAASPMSLIRIDDVSPLLYYVEGGTYIKKRALSLGSPTTVINDADGVSAMCLDVIGGYVYYGTGGGKIKRVSTGGGAATTLVTGEQPVASLAVDTANGYLFWSAGLPGQANTVRRSTTTGTGVTTLLSGCGSNFVDMVSYIFATNLPPSAPTGLTATFARFSAGIGCRLNWTTGSLAANYPYVEIQRKLTVEPECAFRFIATISRTQTSYTDYTIVRGDSYDYRIRVAKYGVLSSPAAEWRHPGAPGDVNDDGILNLEDYHILLDDINQNGSRQLPAERPVDAFYLDPSGDGYITPLDITYTNAQLEYYDVSRWSAKVTIAIPLQTTTTTPPGSQTIALCIASQDDDGFWGTDGVTTGFSVGDMHLGTSADAPNNNVYKNAFMRYQNVPLLPGATVHAAWLEFTSADDRSGPIELDIAANDVDNAPVLQMYADALAMTATSAIVAWDSLPAWITDGIYESPTFPSVVQEVVSRPGWVQNNALCVLVMNGYVGAGGKTRHPVSYNGGTVCATGPKLFINFTQGTTTTTSTTPAPTTTPGPTTTSTTPAPGPTTTTLPPDTCRYVYYVDTHQNKVIAFDRDEPNETVVYASAGIITAADVYAIQSTGWIYFGGRDATNTSRRLRRFNVLTNVTQELVVGLSQDISDVAVDPVAGLVFYTVADRIFKYAISNGTVSELTRSDYSFAINTIELDRCNQFVYWGEDNAGVYRIRYAGSDRVRLVQGGLPRGLAYDYNQNLLFVADRTTGNEGIFVLRPLTSYFLQRLAVAGVNDLAVDMANERLIYAFGDGIRSINYEAPDDPEVIFDY